MNQANNSAQRPRRRGCLASWAVTIIFCLGLLLVVGLGDTLLRSILAPWSLSMGGRPTMIGEWYAPVTLENGVTGTLLFNLEGSLILDEDWFSQNVSGTGRYCFGELSGELEIYGWADRQGDIVDFRFRPMEDDPIWLVHNASSRWQSDTLEISGSYSYDPTAMHISRSDVPEPLLHLNMQRPSGETNCP